MDTLIRSVHLITFLFLSVLNHFPFCVHVISFNSLQLSNLLCLVPGSSDPAAACVEFGVESSESASFRAVVS